MGFVVVAYTWLLILLLLLRRWDKPLHRLVRSRELRAEESAPPRKQRPLDNERKLTRTRKSRPQLGKPLTIHSHPPYSGR